MSSPLQERCPFSFRELPQDHRRNLLGIIPSWTRLTWNDDCAVREQQFSQGQPQQLPPGILQDHFVASGGRRHLNNFDGLPVVAETGTDSDACTGPAHAAILSTLDELSGRFRSTAKWHFQSR
ncbi:hypothetical protein SCOCK_80192 [Actinacidiphila cocklensis]|uniref:Uncharacterized protein n=1 Tax=Actinacidiphila cocklensis TaxID=887465 RepID=A0A9W4E422_9ACTN|nr:hypothetical protein SCOCK_80192 [Actinacidiphila cocklensis]